ncbi:hypothetical protein DPMN_079829 [Dreissena polymorpha]|uniref:P2X purinoreceptor 7 intracellular domain-containing protein n=1 Tax=Dreissena polymorpha TaxID=45954 RepID=A0A9D3YSU9_DREPO|nr:hypothetical protein DPMN_079829 [Dreissena polymorpha]
MVSGFASFSGIPGASELQESAYKDVHSSSCSRLADKQLFWTKKWIQPPEGAESPDWCVCVCEKCREMPTQAERICCEKEPRHCFSLMPSETKSYDTLGDFTVLVLDPAVLRLARLQRRDILLLDDADEEDPHKANRHAAYRQYIMWEHGRLGLRWAERRCIRSILTNESARFA